MTEGLICLLSCVEVCKSICVVGNRKQRRLQLVSRTRKCKFLYFYYMDRELGLMHIRLQSWWPFDVQVCLNGRSYLQRQLDAEGIGYEKRDNCFTRIDDVKRAQQLLDRLTTGRWAKTLSALVNRVNPLRRRGGPLADQRDYYWTFRQSEIATDVMFTSAEALAKLYPSLCRHASEAMHCRDVLGYFGRKLTALNDGPFTTERKQLSQGVRVKHQVEEVVRSLFAYTSGSVYFWEGEVQPDNVVRLSLPTRKLIGEGLRRRDELFKYLASLQDDRVRVVRDSRAMRRPCLRLWRTRATSWGPAVGSGSIRCLVRARFSCCVWLERRAWLARLRRGSCRARRTSESRTRTPSAST